MSAVLVEMSQHQTAAVEWKLYYWYTPDSPLGVFPGRGEYVRMMFEEAGVAYEDVCRKKNSNDDLLGFMKGEKEGFPVQAPPIIQRGDFVMSQTPAIMVYLAKKFGLAPEAGPEGEAHAWQLLLSIHDYHFEGNMSCHPVDLHATAAIQMEEAKVTQKKFCETRMAKYVISFANSHTQYIHVMDWQRRVHTIHKSDAWVFSIF